MWYCIGVQHTASGSVLELPMEISHTLESILYGWMHILGTPGSLRRSGIDLFSARIMSILILQHTHCMMKPPVLIRIHHKLVIGVHHTSMRLEVAKQLLHHQKVRNCKAIVRRQVFH